MADVGKVDGGKLGPGPIGPKKKKDADADHFREMMKSGKVRETDPEEQRKRKSQSEREEEEAAEMTTAQPSNQEKIIPTTTPDTFQLNIKESEGAAVVSEGGFAEPPPPPAPPPFFPSPQVQPDENYPISESDTSMSTPQQPRTERQKRVERKKTETTPPTRPVEKGKKGEKAEKGEKKPPSVPLTGAPKKKETARPEAQEVAAPYTPPQPMAQTAPTKEKPEKEAIAPPLAKGAWEANEDLDKDEGERLKKVVSTKKEIPPTTPFPSTTAPAQAPVTLPGEPLQPVAAPFAHLPAAVAALFERMVGVMTVMTNNTKGVTQTTINLDTPKFANSVFFGAQIIISEYSTAPKAFNIQLLGNQQAVNLFTNNAQELVAAFQAGNYTFKVNRIDTGYLSTPDVRRREVRRVKRKRGAEE